VADRLGFGQSTAACLDVERLDGYHHLEFGRRACGNERIDQHLRNRRDGCRSWLAGALPLRTSFLSWSMRRKAIPRFCANRNPRRI